MRLDEIPDDRSLARRAVTTPAWFVLAVVLTALLPVALPLMALWDVVTGNRFSTVRTALFFTSFFLLESLGLVAAGWLWVRRRFGMSREDYEMANRRLQRWWAHRLFWGTVRIFSVDVDIEGLEQLEDPRPAVVLSRHASTLDTMLPLAVVRQMKLYRYVIKSELLTDPTLDYCGQRFPNVFVDRGSDDPNFEIRKVIALGEDLGEEEAVVVYPEGTRFTEAKRERLLEKFEDDEEMLEITRRLEHTLPPLREGGVKLLSTTPGADVVFIAHRGAEDAAAMSDLVTGGLTGADIDVKIWRVRADDVPRCEEAIREFLVDHWAAIDRFVGGESVSDFEHTAEPRAAE